MAHLVTGLIATTELLNDFAMKRSLRPSVALTATLGLLPLRGNDINAFLGQDDGESVDGFNDLSAALVEELKSASMAGQFLYFETEYFGGAGAQGAVVFEGGEISFGPQVDDIGPINEALARLGVTVAPAAFDAFASVGLDRHRSTDDWFEVDAGDR